MMMSAIESNVMLNLPDDSSDLRRREVDEPMQPLVPTSNGVLLEQLSILKEFILKTPEINQTKVNLLKDELAKGRYRIISGQIATKMLAEHDLI